MSGCKKATGTSLEKDAGIAVGEMYCFSDILASQPSCPAGYYGDGGTYWSDEIEWQKCAPNTNPSDLPCVPINTDGGADRYFHPKGDGTYWNGLSQKVADSINAFAHGNPAALLEKYIWAPVNKGCSASCSSGATDPAFNEDGSVVYKHYTDSTGQTNDYQLCHASINVVPVLCPYPFTYDEGSNQCVIPSTGLSAPGAPPSIQNIGPTPQQAQAANQTDAWLQWWQQQENADPEFAKDSNKWDNFLASWYLTEKWVKGAAILAIPVAGICYNYGRALPLLGYGLAAFFGPWAFYRTFGIGDNYGRYIGRFIEIGKDDVDSYMTFLLIGGVGYGGTIALCMFLRQYMPEVVGDVFLIGMLGTTAALLVEWFLSKTFIGGAVSDVFGAVSDIL
jgi:hypothetical protein